MKHSNWYSNQEGYYCQTCGEQYEYVVDTKTKKEIKWL